MSNILNSKIFKITFFLLLLAEVLSFWGWKFPIVNSVCFWALAVLVLILSLKKLEYGLYFILAELFVGSFGYIFSFNFGETRISLRMILFLVVMAVFLMSVILRRSPPASGDDEESRKNKNTETTTPSDIRRRPLLRKEGMTTAALFTIILLFSFLHGLFRGNGFGNIFLDFNNWLYFLLILPFTRINTNKNTNGREFFKDILSILAAASLFLSLKTLFLFYIFSHAEGGLWTMIYKFVRDTLSGEITHVSGNIWRVFLQSQIYLLISFFIFLCHPRENWDPEMWIPGHSPDSLLDAKRAGVRNDKKRKLLLLITHYLLPVLSLAALIVSFSRSFWVGLGAGILVYLLVVWKRGGGLAFGRNFVKITGVAGAALLVVWLVLILPPQRDEKAFLSALEGRFGLEAAASSRLAQIEPIKQAILKSPLVGYGFGKTITYYSADPRLMPQTAGGSGEITTYAFEWGYLDLILKFGIIGTVVYLFFIFVILRKLLIFNFQFLISKQIKNSNDQSSNLRVTDYELRITSYGLRTGFALALVTLLVVNIFSPYLNHPLGIGFIIISMVMSFRTPIIIGGGIS